MHDSDGESLHSQGRSQGSRVPKSAVGITKERDCRVDPNPAESSSSSKIASIFATPPGIVLSAGIQMLAVRSLTRSLARCPARKLLGEMTALPVVVNDGDVVSVIISKNLSSFLARLKCAGDPSNIFASARSD